jgi:hypothetical protein
MQKFSVWKCIGISEPVVRYKLALDCVGKPERVEHVLPGVAPGVRPKGMNCICKGELPELMKFVESLNGDRKVEKVLRAV